MSEHRRRYGFRHHGRSEDNRQAAADRARSVEERAKNEPKRQHLGPFGHPRPSRRAYVQAPTGQYEDKDIDAAERETAEARDIQASEQRDASGLRLPFPGLWFFQGTRSGRPDGGFWDQYYIDYRDEPQRQRIHDAATKRGWNVSDFDDPTRNRLGED